MHAVFFLQPAMILNCPEKSTLIKISQPGRPPGRRCEPNERKNSVTTLETLITPLSLHQFACSFFSAASYDPKLSEKSTLIKISRPGQLPWDPGPSVRAQRENKISVNTLETSIFRLAVHQSACSFFFLQPGMAQNCQKYLAARTPILNI